MALPSALRGKCSKTILAVIPVVRLLNGGELVASIAGRCRIAEQPSDRTVWELIDREFVHQCVAGRELASRDLPHGAYWYEEIDYTTVKVLNFDNPGLSNDPRERSYQLHHFTCPMHDGEDTVNVQRKIYHRAKGFKLGRLLSDPDKRLPDLQYCESRQAAGY